MIYPVYDLVIDYQKLNLEFDLKYGVETTFSLILDKEKIVAIHREEHLPNNFISQAQRHRLDYLSFCCNLKRQYFKNLLPDMITNFNKLNTEINQFFFLMKMYKSI